MNMALLYSIILYMNLLYLLIFLIIFFLVYYDYMLDIVGLDLYSNICLYSSHSLISRVSGRLYVGMVPISCLPAFACYQPGRSVLPNRSVRYFGTLSNSVPEKAGTIRFLKKLGTEVLQFRYFRFDTGKYRRYRTWSSSSD